MKNLALIGLLISIISCGTKREVPLEDEPAVTAGTAKKVVSIQSYYMDETEINSDEYREFVPNSVSEDSIAMQLLGEDEDFGIE